MGLLFPRYNLNKVINRGELGLGLSPNFPFFNKDGARERLKLGIFNNVFKPPKTRAQIIKLEPGQSPQKSGPTHL
jgi:hypothetical protein